MIAKEEKMVKMMSITVLFLISLCLSAEEMPFAEYKSLDPEIDLLTGEDSGGTGRKLLLFSPLASYRETEYAHIYDTDKNMSIKAPSQQTGLFPYTRMTYFWDPHTKNNYGYVRPARENDISGWYTFMFGDDDGLVFSLLSKNEYWARNSPPYNKISDSKYLISTYSGFMKERPLEFKSNFFIFDMPSKKVIWNHSIISTVLYTDLHWISGPWLLNVSTPHIAGIWKTDTIFNYETNEKTSFAPESIIGYGDGVILTSLQAENGFFGITVWNTDKEILFRDKDFSITAMTYDHTAGRPVINFSYYDYPYIYCNISEMYNTGGPFITLIINLKDKKTYLSPEGYHLHGIFESD
jgi:hypothetical protein